MLKNTRVTGKMDMNRLSEAVSRPGIDPRLWSSLAIVTAIVVDPAEGVFANITLLPSRDLETARVGQCYAGPGFGSHFPIQVDDEVLVVAPSGDPNEGMVIAARLYSKSDPPPQEVVDAPEDVVVHVKAGQNIKIIVENGGQVLLGDADGTQPVALGTILKAHLDSVKSYIDGHVHIGVTPGTPIQLSGVPSTPSPSVPTIEASKVQVI